MEGPTPLPYRVWFRQLPSGEQTIVLDLRNCSDARVEKLTSYLRDKRIPYRVTAGGELELLRGYHPSEIPEMLRIIAYLLRES
jgi:hypothetical protein